MIPADCCAEKKGSLLTVEEALERIKTAVTPVAISERLPLKSCGGRILAADIHAPMDLPPFRNSAMDGYAFGSADLREGEPALLQVIGTSSAGHPFCGRLPTGCCIRVFTGAIVPDEADSVVMQEKVTRSGDEILLPVDVKPRQNVRLAGEEIGRGERILAKGRKLGAADLALLASFGFYEVPLLTKPRIAFFSTGDELRSLTEPLGKGEIYDSNRYLLQSLLEPEPLAVQDMGVIRDDRSALETAFCEAALCNDAIITTGGASLGEADFVRETLAHTGRVEFWKIAMKPGKPLTFGKIGKCLFFGLPGNPVSAAATYEMLVKPALRLLMGSAGKTPLRIRVRCAAGLKKSPGRQEFQRGILSKGEDGEWTVESAGPQGSHMLSVLSKANCYIILPAECAGIDAGSQVEVQPFEVEL